MDDSLHNTIKRARKGDREAFRQLLAAHYEMIFRVSYRFIGNESDAEDVTQEVCMGNEYAFLKIRYKLPNEDKSKLITTPIDSGVEVASIDKASTDARFATAVAAFGQILRGTGTTGDYTYDDVINLAQSAKGSDEFGYRAEFISLVRLAKSAAALQPLENGQRLGPNQD